MLPATSGSASGEEHHDVLAVFRQVALVPSAEALAQPDQQQQGTDTPGDAKHGEERTQFVRPEGSKNLCENIEHHLHSNNSPGNDLRGNDQSYRGLVTSSL